MLRVRYAMLIMAVIGCSFYANTMQAPQTPTEIGGEVHGFVEADLSAAGGKPVRVPDAEVYLTDVQTGKEGPHVKTDASGRFVIPEQLSGRYQLCATAKGFTGKCEPEPLTLGKETLHPKTPIQIVPMGRHLDGRVVLNDGSPCFHESSVFHSRLQADVALLDANGTELRHVQTNSQGFYVIPDVPADGSYRLKVKCGSAEVKTAPEAVGFEALSNSVHTPHVAGNGRPTIVSLVATVGSKRVEAVAPGATVTITAKVRNEGNENIHYQWTDGTVDFVSADTPSIRWKLPKVNATNILSLEVTDGNGGFANSKIVVTTGPIPSALDIVDFHGNAFLNSRRTPGNEFVVSRSEQLAADAGVAGLVITPSHSIPWLILIFQKTCDSDRGCLYQTGQYYQNIGALGAKDTLEKFKKVNNFDQGDTSATYYNAHDLGLGREMHCRRSSGPNPTLRAM